MLVASNVDDETGVNGPVLDPRHHALARPRRPIGLGVGDDARATGWVVVRVVDGPWTPKLGLLISAWLSRWQTSQIDQLLPGFRDDMGAPIESST